MDMLSLIISGESGWGWLILAAILLALDIFAPGFFLVWFAIAAGCVGVLLFAVPLPNPWPLVVFSGVSVLSVYIGRALWGSHRRNNSDKPLLNQRGQQLVGHTFLLAEPLVGGRGFIKVGDGVWLVTGPDLPVGELVRVMNADGSVLTVEAAEHEPGMPKTGSFPT